MLTVSSAPSSFLDWLSSSSNVEAYEIVRTDDVLRSAYKTLKEEDLHYLASRPTKIVLNAEPPASPRSPLMAQLEAAFEKSAWSKVVRESPRKADTLHDIYHCLMRFASFAVLNGQKDMVGPLADCVFKTLAVLHPRSVRPIIESATWDMGVLACENLIATHIQGKQKRSVPRFLLPFVRSYIHLPVGKSPDNSFFANFLDEYDAAYRARKLDMIHRRRKKAYLTRMPLTYSTAFSLGEYPGVDGETASVIQRMPMRELCSWPGFCGLRIIPRHWRRAVACRLGPWIDEKLLVMISYALSCLHAPIRHMDVCSYNSDVSYKHYVLRREMLLPGDNPFLALSDCLVGGSRGTMSNALDALGSTIHKDAVLDNYTAHTHKAIQKSLDLCPNSISEPNFSKLKKAGLPVDPYATGAHPHPALKAIEVAMLDKLTYLLRDDCTVSFMKREKFNKLQKANPRFKVLDNVNLTIRDTTRWQGGNHINSITTPDYFLHDVGHYITPAEVAYLFDTQPKVNRIFFSAILPDEVLLGHPSWHPTLYQLSKLDEHTYAYILAEDGESYEQPYSTLSWLTSNRIGRPEGKSHGVEVLAQLFSHKLICVHRHVPPVSKRWYVADAPDDVILPEVDGRVYAHSRQRVPRDVFNSVLQHSLGLANRRFESTMAKVRTKSADPRYADINTDTWLALAQVCYALSLSPAQLEREAPFNTYAAFCLRQVRRLFHRHDWLLPALSAGGMAVSWGSLLLPILGIRVPDYHVASATIPGWSFGAFGALLAQAAVVVASSRIPPGLTYSLQAIGLVLPHVAYLVPNLHIGSLTIPSYIGGIAASLVATGTIALFDGPGPHYEVRDFLKRMPKREYVTWKLGTIYVNRSGSSYSWLTHPIQHDEPPPYTDLPPEEPTPIYAPTFNPPALPYEQDFPSFREAPQAGPDPQATQSTSYHAPSVSEPCDDEEFTSTSEQITACKALAREVASAHSPFLGCDSVHAVRQAYFRLSKLVHPDRCDHPLATAAFKNLGTYYAEAYAPLDTPPISPYQSAADTVSLSSVSTASLDADSIVESLATYPLRTWFNFSQDEVFEPDDFFMFEEPEQQDLPFPPNSCLLTAFSERTGVSTADLWRTLCRYGPRRIVQDPRIIDAGLSTECLIILAYAYDLRVHIMGEVPANHPDYVGVRRPTQSNLPLDEIVIYIELGTADAMGHWSSRTYTPFFGARMPSVGAKYSPPHRPLTGFEKYLSDSVNWCGETCLSPWKSYNTNASRAKAYARDLKNNCTGTIKRNEGKDSIPPDFTARMDSMVDNHVSRPVLISVAYGAPGSSKSSGIIQALNANWTRKTNLWKISTPRKRLRDSITAQMKLGSLSWKCGTFENSMFKTGTTLIIDEISQMPPGYVDYCLIKDSSIRSVVLIGDVTQGEFHEPNAESSLNAEGSEALYFKMSDALYRLYSNSIPQAVSDAIGLPTRSKVKGFIKMAQRPDASYPLVCASEGEQKMYSANGYDAYTFGTVQGQRFENAPVQISVSNATAQMVSRGHFISAMCRSNVGVIFIHSGTQQAIRSISTDPFLSGLFCGKNRFNYADLFRDELTGFKLHTPPGLHNPNLATPARPAYAHSPVNTFTTFRGAIELPYFRAPDSLTALLTYGDEDLPEHVQHPTEIERGPPTSGFEESEEYLIQQYGDIPSREERESYYRGEQSRQFDDTPWYVRQGLDSTNVEQLFPRQKNDDLVTSHAAIEKRLRFAPEHVNRKRYEARTFMGPILFDGYCRATGINPSTIPAFDELLYAQCIHENEFVKLTKKTQQTLANNADRSDPDWRYAFVRIFVKSQLKVKLETLGSPFKPGQTLASFQDAVILVTGPMTRYLTIVADKLYRPGFYYHPGHSALQMSAWCQKNWKPAELNSTNDYSAFDQSQTGEALAMEILKMRTFHIPEHVIFYYEELKLSLTCQFGALAVMRFTGEGPTLLFNSDFNTALVGCQYEMPSDTPLMVAGDDLAINGVFPERRGWQRIKRFLTIEAKPERVKTATFCSWLITPHGAIKEPRVVLAKLLIARDRREENKVIPSLLSEVAIGYHLGDHVYEHLDELSLASHFYLIRYFVKHSPIRFRLLLTTRSLVEVLDRIMNSLDSATKERIIALNNALSEVWMLEAKPVRIAASVISRMGVLRLRDSRLFDNIFQRIHRF